MIVTFHLAVYFAYYFWDNYISVILFEHSDNDQNVSQNSDNVNSAQRNPVSETEHVQSNSSPNEPNVSSRPIDENLTNKRSSNQVKEGEVDLPPCTQHIFCGEDEDQALIYNVEPEFKCYLDEKGIKFVPPVYTQRYMVIEKMLNKIWAKSVKKVVDFGCAELTFERRHLKKLPGVEEIVSVDIDFELLSDNKCRLSPFPVDHLQPRKTPLHVRIFCGSVAHTNDVLAGTDAVIAIELIEHLYPYELECLPFTVFGYIKPKLAIFTTPNADFNVLFPNFTGFRHDDHKFEWSRQQFEDWGSNLVQRYPEYTVTFKGIGPGPDGFEDLGSCSQMATFVKTSDSNSLTEDDIHVQDGEYKLVEEFVYPYFEDKRTRDEIIRDEAVCLINRWRLLSKQYDEYVKKEIPLKAIMEKVKCYNKEKLKNILFKDCWEVIINQDGHEVVLLPDSDMEDHDSCSEHSTEETSLGHWDESYNTHNNETTNENWDIEVIEPKMNMNSSGNIDCPCKTVDSKLDVSSFSYESDGTQMFKTTCHDSIVYDFDQKCCNVEEGVPDDSFVLDSFISNVSDNFHQKDSSEDYSVYETPYGNGPRTMRSDCELINPSDQSLYHDQTRTHNGCNKELSFETTDIYRDRMSDRIWPSSDPEVVHSKTDSLCCASDENLPLNASTYATPCCSKLHKQNIPKCLSLQQINERCSSPSLCLNLDSCSRENLMPGGQIDSLSKSMEGIRNHDSWDIHDTYSNASKVIDSGYPDSYSEHGMDMDLTPEQFDDIETESEGNDVSSDSFPSPLAPVQQLLHAVEEVENGDVANNNRDGEGNNVVADMEEDPLEFEAQIEEVNEFANMAAVDQPDHERQVHEGSTQNHCSSESSVEEKYFVQLLKKSQYGEDSKCTAAPEDSICSKEYEDLVLNTSADQSFRGNPSNSSLLTSSSWSHLDSSESQSNFDPQEDVIKFEEKQDFHKLKTHDSLTTVLDGSSKFSNCSLVLPIHIKEEEHEIQDNHSAKSFFPEWMLNIDDSLFEHNIGDRKREFLKESSAFNWCCVPLQQNHPSLLSVYESASSLKSISQNVEISPFPDWLLNIGLPDTDEDELNSQDSVISVWDSDSFEDRDGLNFDVQIDTRGGGDPQSETWH